MQSTDGGGATTSRPGSQLKNIRSDVMFSPKKDVVHP